MSNQKQIKKHGSQLEIKVKQLQLSTKTESTLSILSQISKCIQNYDLQSQQNIPKFLYAYIKPVLRQVTNINIKMFPQSRELLEKIIFDSIMIYCKTSKKYFHIEGFQLLKQIIERSTQLFKITEEQSAADISQSEKNVDKQQLQQDQLYSEYQWIRENFKTKKSYKTPFFVKCCNEIIAYFADAFSVFGKSNLSYIREYFIFLDAIEWYIKRQKIQEIALKSINALQEIFKNPEQNKDIFKQINFESCQYLITSINKVIRQNLQHGIKKRIEIIPSYYGLWLLFNHKSIEKKMNGLKFINKWSKHFTANFHCALKQEQYCEFLKKNNILQFILQNTQNLTIIKTCNDVVRLFVRRKCLSDETFQIFYDHLQNKSIPEVRQLIFKYMDMQSLKLQYNHYQIIINRLKKIRDGEYYEEQMFNLLIEIFRYATYNQIKRAAQSLVGILTSNWGKFRNERIQSKCMQTFVKAMTKIIEKNTDISVGNQDLIDAYDKFMQVPSYLGIKIIKNVLSSLPDVAHFSKNRAAFNILKNKPILDDGLKLLKQDINFKEELEDFICFLLSTARDTYNQKLIFSSQAMWNATISPKIFEQMLDYINYSEQIQGIFENLVTVFQTSNFPFCCLKSFFYKLNHHNVCKIRENYADNQFQLSTTSNKLKGISQIRYLLQNAINTQIRNQIADFITDLYTIYRQQISKEGEEQLKIFMKQVSFTSLEAFQNKNQKSLCSKLALMQYLMMSTQTLGPGLLKPHNSVVVTSTVHITIYNQITDYNNDVLKVFQKRMPSNMTVFQLIQQVSKHFKCSPCQIMLRLGGKTLPDKWNGLILEEVNFDGKILSAVKSFRERIRRQPLLINDQLNPKAKTAFEQIYNHFAVDGKMGRRQCSHYVEGVTRTSCYLQDYRVNDFFREWDDDKDDNITLNDFLRFYKSNCVPDKQKNELVWKNLHIMRYRKNLKKYDQPIEPPSNDLLYRYYLSEDQRIYKMLFQLTKCEIQEIKQRSIKILFRLPTCPYILNSFSQNLNLVQRSTFETEYLLMTIVNQLNKCEDKSKGVQDFVSSGNALSLFQMMLHIDQIQNKTPAQSKCLSITLQILRYVSCVPHLRENISAIFQLKQILILPETQLFQRMIQKSLKQSDFATLQSSLALQICQKTIQIDGIIEAAFHQQVQIRKMMCNYVFICYIINKIDIDLFKVKLRPNCQFWYEVLEKIIQIKKQLNFEQILSSALQTLAERSQNLENNPQDMIITGNLRIIKTIINTQKAPVPQKLFDNLENLSQKVLSNKNRLLIYEVMCLQDDSRTFQFIQNLISSVNPQKQVPKRNNFVGIKNLGSTCYMNSILQVIFQIGQFKQLILNLKNQSQLLKTEIDGLQFYDDVLYQLQKMYTHLHLSYRQYYNPKQFCLAIKDPITKKPINTCIQEDVHQFIARYLESLEKYMKDDEQKLKIFKNIFQGKTLTQFTCQQCHNKITREQNFLQLSMQVNHCNNLQKSFQKFIEPESISDYFCEQCQKKVEKIQKSTYLSQLPKNLILNLRRIIFDLQTFRNVKLDSKFYFPFEIDVSDFTSNQVTNITHQDCYYQLKAIVIHSGTSESGHYYSIIKINDQWYKFNDQSVTKYDIKDIAREAFGGGQSYDQWSDQLKFSTNAYILFYQKKQNSSLKNKTQIKLNQDLLKQIQLDNQLFFKQLQVHQESIFDFALNYYEAIKPNGIQQNIKVYSFDENYQNNPFSKNYQRIYNLFQKLLVFMETFYEVRGEIICKMGSYIYQLFYLLPEKAYQFLMKVQSDYLINNICLHNHESIRQLHSTNLPKAIHVYSLFYGLNLQGLSEEDNQSFKVLKILDQFYNFMKDERFLKNIYKSYRYFETWRILMLYIETIKEYVIEKQTLVILVDILMGNDSPIANKDMKCPQIPSIQAYPIIYIIQLIMQYKKNLLDYINPSKTHKDVRYRNLTENQKKMIGNIKFYKKMIKNRCQSQMLSKITGKLAEGDLKFSQELVQMFLKGLNCSYDEAESSLLMLNHLNQYLSIDDQYVQNRMKWVLGISQLQMGENQNYGIRYTDQSTVYSYVSPLFFIANDQYQPALQVLFLKRTLYTQFSIDGVALLLKLLINSKKIFEYVMSLPAPSYIYRHYPDWIWQYIMKLKDEDSYYLQVDKSKQFERLNKLYNQFSSILHSSDLDLPVNKLIIGTNKQCSMIDSLGCSDYQMALWAHHTYVLQNLPTGTMNKSLPKQFFKYSEPSQLGKYFLSMQGDKQSQVNNQLVSMFSVYTLYLDTKKPLKIRFKFQNFKEQVHFQDGKIQINFQYEELEHRLSQYIDIQIVSQEQNLFQMDLKVVQEEKDFPSINQHYNTMQAQNYAPKQCGQCTFINYGRQDQCQVCGYKLY